MIYITSTLAHVVKHYQNYLIYIQDMTLSFDHRTSRHTIATGIYTTKVLHYILYTHTHTHTHTHTLTHTHMHIHTHTHTLTL